MRCAPKILHHETRDAYVQMWEGVMMVYSTDEG